MCPFIKKLSGHHRDGHRSTSTTRPPFESEHEVWLIGKERHKYFE